MKIRRATIEDMECIFALILQLAEETNQFVFSAAECIQGSLSIKEFIKKLIFQENSYLLIAFKGELPIGLGFLDGGNYQRTHHSAILGLGVLKKWWRMGFGKEILERLLEIGLSEEHLAKIDLQVRVDNLPAIALYKKMGFQTEGRIRKALFLENRFYDCLWMGLEMEQ